MKCFSFSNKEKNDEQRTIKSISVRSTSTSMSTDLDMKPSGSEFNSQNVSEVSTASSAKSFAVLSQRQSNLREFTFSELKAATKNFSRSLMIGEGGFGGVYKGVIRGTDDTHKKIDVAIKQLSRRGLQASFLLLLNFESENKLNTISDYATILSSIMFATHISLSAKNITDLLLLYIVSPSCR